MKLAYIAAAWLVGVLVGLETDTPLAPLLLLMGGSITFGLALRLRGLPVFPAVLALLLLLGVWRADSVSSPSPVLAALPVTGQSEAKVTLGGRINSDPEFSGGRVRFTLEVRAVKLGQEGVSLDGRILVYANPPDDLVARRSPPYFDFGDLVTLTGRLRRPEPFGGFDYPSYLASQGITEIMSADAAAVIGESGGWREWPYMLRGRLSESIEDTIPYPQSALGQALLLGLRGDLPPDMVQNFRSTGTSHLLAISGLQVGVLVVMFLAGSAWLFGRRGFYFLAVPLIAVWAYALVTGLPPSVVRAAVMGSVYLVAVGVGRPGSILPALAFSAGIMTAISPEIIQRVSFQLSFAAMGGIALTQPFIPRWSPAAGPDQAWWQSWAAPLVRAPLMMLVISWSAMLATWPLLAFNFREVALPGIIVTVLGLPAMPFIMAGTLAAAVVCLFSATIGQLIGWL
ncbi:MAG: ComEC/Rec2 family competence protein, partial [Dehalococcoidia bacterium]